MKFYRSAAAILLIAGNIVLLTGCGNPNCVGETCIEIISGYYSKELNSNGIGYSTYASVYFSFTEKGVNVGKLTESNMNMEVNGRNTKNEADKKLTQSNGLVVFLLIDTSYSITQSGSAEAVRSSAISFINSLPDSGVIGIGQFASEAQVPIFQKLDMTTDTTEVLFYNKAQAAIIAERYKPYETAVSESQTKLYDAISRLCLFAPTDSRLKRLQSVMVVFTDGQDTASKNYRTANEVKSWCSDMNPRERIYTIGLGNDIDENALKTISDGRFYRATNASNLQSAFNSVSRELTSIYLLKVLVAGTENNAKGVVSVQYNGKTVTAEVKLSSID